MVPDGRAERRLPDALHEASCKKAQSDAHPVHGSFASKRLTKPPDNQKMHRLSARVLSAGACVAAAGCR